MYLATALVGQYIPGVEIEDNNRLADRAIEQYEYVLSSNAERAQRLNSSKSIGYLYLNMKKWDDAKKYYQIASDLDPKDPEPDYSIGVLDWTVCYQPRMEARMRLGCGPRSISARRFTRRNDSARNCASKISA
jgi:tetratricopeptide (TPR) repeat protein